MIELIPIRAGEGGRVGRMVLLYFFLGLAFVTTQTAAFALFLAGYGAERLPYAYLLTAALAALVAFGYLRLVERLPFPTLLTANLGLLLAGTLAVWLGLAGPAAPLLVFALPLWFQLLVNLGSLAYWALAGSLFDVRQGKRLYGLITAGNWLGSCLAALVVGPFVGRFGTANLLLLAAAALVAALATLRSILGRHLAPAPASGATVAPTTRPGRDGNTLRSRYATLIFAFIFVWWLSFYVVDMIFLDQTAAYFGGADQIARFLSAFFGLAGLIALVTTALFTGPLLSRYGLWAGLLLVPILVITAIAALAVAGPLGAPAAALFGLAAGAKLVSMGLGFAIDQPAHSVLYKPFSVAQVGRVTTVAEGIVQPLAIGAAGLTLLVLKARLGLDAAALAACFALVGAAWIAVVLLLIRAYPAALARAFARRQLSDGAGSLADPQAVALLRHELRSQRAGSALYALHALRESGDPALAAELPAALAHAAPEVRREAARAVEQLAQAGLTATTDDRRPTTDHNGRDGRPQPGGAVRTAQPVHDQAGWLANQDRHRPKRFAPASQPAPAAAAFSLQPSAFSLALGPALRRSLAAETEPEVRAAKLRALLAIDPLGFEALAAAMGSRDQRERCGAIVGLIRYGGIDGVLAAGGPFTRLAASADPGERALAAQILGEVGLSHFYHPLCALLEDADSRVRRAALQAAGQVRHEALWPAVIAAGGHPATARAAAAALAAGGDAALDAIEGALAHWPTGTLVTLVRACARHEGARATGLIAGLLPTPRAELRDEALDALVARRYSAAEPAPLRRLLEAEVAQAAWLAAAMAGVDAEADAPLLARALADELARARGRAIGLLALLYEPARRDAGAPGVIARARQTILAGPSAGLAPAIEAVEALLPPAVGAMVRPLLEPLAPAERLARLQRSVPQPALGRTEALSAIVAGPQAAWLHPWTRACAVEAAARLTPAACAAAIAAAAAAPEPLVSATAGRLIAHGGPDAVEGAQPLLTIEKVIILKTVGVFSRTPEATLASVAELLEELEVAPGRRIFTKGDQGDSLYIIIEGRVRVHDGDRLLNELGEREVFGEMALLDPEPRLASVTAVAPTRLFRLAQAPFYELLDEQPEVAVGVIRVLTGHLRARVREKMALEERLRAYEGGAGGMAR